MASPLLPSFRLEIREVVSSTHDILVDEVRAGTVRPGRALMAREQTAGHGRMGRPWRSAVGDTVLLSAVAGPVDPALAPKLSPIAALALIDLLTDLGLAEAAGWKWPNDVLLHGRKTAGILLGLAQSGGHGDWLTVVSVGLNRRPPGGAWPEELLDRAVALSRYLSDDALPPPMELARDFLGHLSARLENGLESVDIPAEIAQHLDIGRTVAVRQGDRTISGELVGVDPLGRLLLRVDGALRTLSSGELD